MLHLFRWPTCQKPYYAHFDVNVALSQYIPVTLSIDFRYPDSKVSRLSCSHIQNIDMLTYQSAKCSFTFYQRHSFTLDQFRNIFSRLSCLTGALHVYILLKTVTVFRWVNFDQKSVKFLFLLSIILFAFTYKVVVCVCIVIVVVVCVFVGVFFRLERERERVEVIREQPGRMGCRQLQL